jgi:hypothetical protein
VAPGGELGLGEVRLQVRLLRRRREAFLAYRVGVRWLAEGSAAALAGALREVAPKLTGYPIDIDHDLRQEDPRWWSATALLGGEFVAKFAWSRPAALRVRHEMVPYLPEVVVGSTDPLLLVTRRVPGTSLFAVADSIDRDEAGRQLARFLAALGPRPRRGRDRTAARRPSADRDQRSPGPVRRLGRPGAAPSRNPLVRLGRRGAGAARFAWPG